MDLAKIIGELKLELQCLDAAITSMEELARVQNAGTDEGTEVPAAPQSAEGPVVLPKRRRGRPPRKSPSLEGPVHSPESSQDEPPGDTPGGAGSA